MTKSLVPISGGKITSVIRHGVDSVVQYGVDQSGASAGGDLVGRDKVTTYETHNHFGVRRTQIEGWLEILAIEMKDNKRVQDMVDSLQYFHKKHSVDGINGLEAKLKHAGRASQYGKALRRKEHFSKLLDKYSHFGSAQQIFALLLSKIDTSFDSEILPYIDQMKPAEIDQLVNSKLIDPIVAEIGAAPFLVDYNHAAGMVYWLAEQCFVRWHK